jgi:hypothetical protein
MLNVLKELTMSDYQGQKKNFAPQRDKTLLDEWTLKLTAEPDENATERFGRRQNPTFAVGVRKGGKINFTVYTNVKDDRNNGKIEANMTLYGFNAVMAAIQELADGKIPEKRHFPFENKRPVFKDGKPSETLFTESTTIVGVDKEDAIFIALSAKSRPSVRFYFLPDGHQHLGYSDGTPVAKSAITRLYAKGILKTLQDLVTPIAIANYEPPEPKGDSGGGQSGGYKKPYEKKPYNNDRGGSNSRNDSYGGSSGASDSDFGEGMAEYDDDIPV